MRTEASLWTCRTSPTIRCGARFERCDVDVFPDDQATGHRVAGLKAPAALSRGGNLKVAATYPEVAFTIRQGRTANAGTAKVAKAAQ